MENATDTIKPAYDAVVIGTGMGGLAAGGWLARAGLSVACFDKHSKLGGYGQYFGHEPTFDSATLLLPGPASGGWLHSVLAPLGALDRLELLRLDPSYRIVSPGQDVLVPPDAEAYRNDLSARFPAESAAIARFFAEVETIGRSFLSLAEGPPSGGALEKFQFLTLANLFHSTGVRDSGLQAVLGALWPLLGLPASQVSAVQYAALWHTFHQQGGTCAVRGGMKQLGQALADTITERGGLVRMRTAVRRILRSRGRATGVELEDGTRVQAAKVIANCNPHDLFEQLIDQGNGRGPRYPALSFASSVSALQVHMCVAMEAPGPARTTFYSASGDSDRDYENLQREEPQFDSLVASVLSHGDPERAPGGKQIVLLMALQPYSRADGWQVPFEQRRGKEYRTLPEYLELKDRMGSRLAATAEAVLPGLNEQVVARKVGTPVTMERYTFNTMGAAFGWSNIPQQCGTLRPGPRSPVNNLYLAGHWNFPGSGVHAALVSGRLAAEAALRDG